MKFKNNKELTAFILLNLFGSPLVLIVAYIFLNWYGLVGCFILVFMSFRLWIYYGKHTDAKLSISPKLQLFTNKKLQ